MSIQGAITTPSVDRLTADIRSKPYTKKNPLRHINDRPKESPPQNLQNRCTYLSSTLYSWTLGWFWPLSPAAREKPSKKKKLPPKVPSLAVTSNASTTLPAAPAPSSNSISISASLLSVPPSITDGLSDIERENILEEIRRLPEPIMQKVLSQSSRLITSWMVMQSRLEIIQTLSHIPIERMDEVIEQSLRLITKDSLGHERANIIHALGSWAPYRDLLAAKFPSIQNLSLNYEKNISRIFSLASLLITPKMDVLEILYTLGCSAILLDLLPIVERMDSVERQAFLEAAQYAILQSVSPQTILSWFLPQPALIAAIRLNDTSYSKNSLWEGIPQNLQWQLGMDRKYLPEGPDFFDNGHSPGYRKGMENGHRFLDKIRDSRLNAHLLSMIHDVAVDGVSDCLKGTKTALQKGYRSGWHYHIDCASISKTLLEEWETEKLILTPDTKMRIEETIRAEHSNLDSDRQWVLIDEECGKYLAETEIISPSKIKSRFKDGDEPRINAIFDRFYKEAAEASNMEAKYAAVARCCRALQIFHAFPDANGRTICFALFTLLLYQIGSDFAILTTPALFDGSKTIAQMVEGIQDGIRYFKGLF